MRRSVGAATGAKGRILALVTGLLALGLLVGAPQTAPASAKVPPDLPPVIGDRPFADPSVIAVPGGYLALSTGALVPRATSTSPAGPWATAPKALVTLPPWGIRPEVWAADAIEVGGQWLLYYSMPVAGLDFDDRCIGVAVSPSPTGTFTPVGPRPLICPKEVSAPRAYDTVRPSKKKPLPAGGVIDPSVFVDTEGSIRLLYRTQDIPSTIRTVTLDAAGIRTQPGQRSREILRVEESVAENPVLVRRPGHYVLFTSEGDYRGCRYRTTWRKAEDLDGLDSARRKLLLKRGTTGVCGPGGADVLDDPAGQTLAFFHGWTCPLLGGHCPADFFFDRDKVLQPRRAMYAATLRWTARDRPIVVQFLAPPPPPPPPPPPAPTPAPTPAPPA